MNKQKLLQTIQNIQQRIDSVTNQIDPTLPNIYYVSNQKYTNWYSTDGHLSTYISNKNNAYIKKLVINKYLIAKLDYLTKEIFLLKQLQTQLSKVQDISSTMLSSNSRYAPFLHSPESIIPENYNTEPYIKNTNHPEQLIHTCPSGNIVRSKSEVLIDSALFNAGLNYHYEEQLTLSDNIFYPDFKIWHPEKMKFIFWEHFGMIDNPRYLSNALSKLSFYIANDIIPNDNLILTFETQTKPLTLSQIENTINIYF